MAQITHFDGYLSNKKELAKEFGEKEDKELALSAYEKYGEDFAKHLEGMFGIIIKDESKTVLVRDRFGNESVYYYLTGNEIVCGLTMNEILNSGKYEKEINHEALELFLTYSYLPGKKTFFSGIMKVMPGHVMTFEDGKLSDKQYFKIEYERDDSKSLDEYAKEINDTLNELVDDWKIPGENYGNFLSGGVDSAYLAALTKPKYTFSTAYENKEFDESELAAKSAEAIGTEHVKVFINPEDYFGVIPEAMKKMEQPLADASTIAFFLACRGAKKYVDVCYSGEGADELFCGYHAYVRRLVNLQNPDYPNADVETYYIGNTKLFNEDDKKKLLKEYDGSLTPLALANSLYDFDEKTDDVTKMMLCDLNCWFEGDIMLNAEKMSKAAGIVARTPFLDSRLYSIAKHIPSEYKVSLEESKIVFRTAAANMIPNEVAFRKKLGFAVPARSWMREEKYFNIIKSYFESDNAKLFFNEDYLKVMLSDEFLDGQNNWRKTWAVYVFLVWYNEYFG